MTHLYSKQTSNYIRYVRCGFKRLKPDLIFYLLEISKKSKFKNVENKVEFKFMVIKLLYSLRYSYVNNYVNKNYIFSNFYTLTELNKLYLENFSPVL